MVDLWGISAKAVATAARDDIQQATASSKSVIFSTLRAGRLKRRLFESIAISKQMCGRLIVSQVDADVEKCCNVRVMMQTRCSHSFLYVVTRVWCDAANRWWSKLEPRDMTRPLACPLTPLIY